MLKLNMLNTNSNHRFHKCMPKECHAIYDTLKLMEAQDNQDKKDKKVEAEAKTKENELLNTKKDEFKSDNLVDISA